ncbi:MAG TPA: hypothetical protein VLA00_08455 [Xanthobacteraceae bacterium]|nr:hypothetical protein [Xanthobacteraceae bacterium]
MHLPIVRLRAGLLVMLALAIVAFIGGRWSATLLSLGTVWAALLGVALALLLGVLLAGLGPRAYAGVAVVVTLVAMYTVYDFARGPVDWSAGTALALTLVPALLLGLAFRDFWQLTRELRAWARQLR